MLGDFGSRLDEALERWKDAGTDQLGPDVPEVREYVRVAHRLQVLLPAPIPHLAVGRRRFLDEAERQYGNRNWLDRWMDRVRARPAMALVAAAVFVLIIGGTISYTAGSMLSGAPGTPIWDSSTPTTRPTFEATPTHISLAPANSTAMLTDRVPLVKPLPLPAPVSRAAPSDTLP